MKEVVKLSFFLITAVSEDRESFFETSGMLIKKAT